MSNDGNAVLQDGDVTVDLPLTKATEGNSGYGISALMKTTGNTTLDPGFTNTASCESAITYIDGDEGILRYRGYPIDQLADNADFLETAWLLIYGELPTESELKDFTAKVAEHTVLDETLVKLLDGFNADAHPMAMLQAGVVALGTFNSDVWDPRDADQVEQVTVRVLGALPTLAAHIFRKATGQEFIASDPSLGYVQNFLNMCFGTVDEKMVEALDTLLILHADHEQNCSTSTVRVVGSSEANLYASLSAGIGALWGPLHGGANQAVLEMLEKIQSSDDGATEFMDKVKNKVDGVRLMGFGHRVYKNYDPRAAIVKKHADTILRAAGAGEENELLQIALKLEETALADDYFVERKLYPNVDFYTGLIYEAFGFPVSYFTVLFALGRMPGWIAQWRELMTDKSQKIARPRQVYTGAGERDYPGK